MSTQGRFTGKTVYVIGASHGIGEETARAFAADGAEVLITGRSKERLDAAAERIGHTVRVFEADATRQADVDALFAAAGKIDHLVLAVSGGMVGLGALADLTDEALREGFEGKVFAQLRVLKAALAHLAADASVTFIAAGSSRAAFPGTVALAAANGALDAAVPPLATELAPIRVNAVSPGVIDTAWWHPLGENRDGFMAQQAAATPVGRVGRPHDVAEAVLFLAGNGFTTGVVLDVNGGTTLAAGK
ncbi:SDR family oxidoreductase [Catenulispora yoronensis]|uniref:SDR family oxidoreductase n=1 Tax=Catenulispora yoronensis TaxID=450799 RepID=A0ABP5GC68_9ACTN